MITLIKENEKLYKFNPIEKLKGCAFEYNNIKELELEKDISDLFISDYYLSSGNLMGVIEDMNYNDIDVSKLIELVEVKPYNLGYTPWQLCFIKDDDLYIIVRSEI